MNLVVDIGNTVLKAALAEETVLGKTFRYQGENPVGFVVSLVKKHYPECVVVCSARTLDSDETASLEACCQKFILIDPDHHTLSRKASIPEYVTPASVASIIAARHLFKGKGCSIFDFGTMLSTAFLDSAGNYLGGNISPGCTTRFRSISRYARNLPLLAEREEDAATSLGHSLDSSIRAGVVSGIMFEVDGYLSIFPENIAVFTGGDAIYFAKRMKKATFVVCNLVMTGLALIAVQCEKAV